MKSEHCLDDEVDRRTFAGPRGLTVTITRPQRSRPMSSVLLADQLEIVWLVRDCPISISAYNYRSLHIEESGHLVSVLLDRTDSISKERSFQPSKPHSGIEEVPQWMGPRQIKQSMLIDDSIGIADSLHVSQAVIFEIGFRAFRCP